MQDSSLPYKARGVKGFGYLLAHSVELARNTNNQLETIGKPLDISAKRSTFDM
jgi:hypothetical protein